MRSLTCLALLLIAPLCTTGAEAPQASSQASVSTPAAAPVGQASLPGKPAQPKRIIGMSLEDLIALHGEGEVVAEQGDSLVLRYPKKVYTLRAGKVVSSRIALTGKGNAVSPSDDSSADQERTSSSYAAVRPPAPPTPEEVLCRYGYRVRAKAGEWGYGLSSSSSYWWDWSYYGSEINSCVASNGWPNRYTFTGTSTMYRNGVRRTHGFDAYLQLNDHGGVVSIEIMPRY